MSLSELSEKNSDIGIAENNDTAVTENDERQWFVMRSSYSREMKAKALLEKDNFVCYIPMRKERKERNGRVVTRSVPVIHNLVFVFTTREAMDPWKRIHEEDAALRYTIDRSTSQPMIVSDKAMHDFIRVTKDVADNILYLDNPDVAITKGQRVEVIAGPFAGVQGNILRIRRDRRIVVTIEGVIAVAMASMPLNHLRIIE